MRNRYYIYQFTSWFTLQNNDVVIDFCVGFNVIDDDIQKMQRHDDVIETHACDGSSLSGQRATMQLI